MTVVSHFIEIFLKENKWNFILLVVTNLIINLTQSNGMTFLTANIINSVQKGNYSVAITFFKYFIIVAVFYIIMNYHFRIMMSNMLNTLRQWVRYQLVRILVLTNNENFSGMNFSKLNSPINRASVTCYSIFSDLIEDLLPILTFWFVVTCYFFYHNKWFGIGFLLGNVTLVLYIASQWNDMVKTNMDYENNVFTTEFHITEIMNNMDKIIYRGKHADEMKTFSEERDKNVELSNVYYKQTSWHLLVGNAIVLFVMAACILYLTHLYSRKKISITVFITFFTLLILYRDKSATALSQIPPFIDFIGRSQIVEDNFGDVLKKYNEQLAKSHLTVDLPFSHAKFQDVSFKYEKTDKIIFDHFNLDIHLTGNKIIGITGISGKGKSSLAKLLIKLYSPTAGKVYIDGHDVSDLSTEYIRANITYVNQNSKLFDKNILDNIMYGCIDPDKCNTFYKEIVKYPKIRELYQNIDMEKTNVGPLGEKLSGGQRQVVNLMGGLVNPSKILILDEPTNALDAELKQDILSIIRDFKQYKQCILIITHDQEVHSLFDEKIEI